MGHSCLVVEIQETQTQKLGGLFLKIWFTFTRVLFVLRMIQLAAPTAVYVVVIFAIVRIRTTSHILVLVFCIFNTFFICYRCI